MAGVEAISATGKTIERLLHARFVADKPVTQLDVKASLVRTEDFEKNGQSFVIAGLIDNRLTTIGNKIPGLGDIPILGNLFKSKNAQKSKTELMVLCTVHRIAPSNQEPAGPGYPQPFLDDGKFDGKKPSPGSK